MSDCMEVDRDALRRELEQAFEEGEYAAYVDEGHYLTRRPDGSRREPLDMTTVVENALARLSGEGEPTP